MRKSISAGLLLLAILAASCKGPYFTSVNNMRSINGTVYLKDGKELNGQITSMLGRYYSSNSSVNVTTDGGKEQKVFVTDIKAVEVRNNYYEPKLIDMGFGARDKMLFVKRLTKENSRINLYELYEQVSNTSYRNGNSYTYYSDQYSYYISVPGNRQQGAEVWNIEGRHLTPNFEDKMSEIVNDCPSLAEKIKQKEKGYFYAQVSLSSQKRIETMMNIIDEYNKCR